MGLIDLILFGVVAGGAILLTQIVWIPFWAAGVINGIGHYCGYRHWATPDASRNIAPLGILIGGEELHNNHHAYATSAKLSAKWYEFDIGWLYIRILEALGLATVKKVAPTPRFELAKTMCDYDTLQAVIANRYDVLARYGQALKRTWSDEVERLQRWPPRDAELLKPLKRASMMQTTATPDGDYFEINGTKMFPTFPDVADFVQLFARLPGTKGREGVTCFLIDTGTPGYRVVRSIATIAGTEPFELVFEDCRVHKSQVLGEVGNGWALNQAWLGARRFQVGIRAHGMSHRVLSAVAQVLRHDAKEGEKHAGIIGHFLAELEALKALTYSASWRADQKMDVRVDVSAKVKLFGTELAHKVIDFALEAVGPSAMRKEHVIARAFRHARARRIIEGPSEVQRHIIQRELFRQGTSLLELQ